MSTETGMRIAQAFRDGRACRIRNTGTHRDGYIKDRHGVWGGAPYVALHGHIIAYRDRDGVVMLTLAGYPTRTTRDRLNAILEAYGSGNRFFQDKWCRYYGRRATFHNDEIEIGPRDWVPIAGPLGMQALLADRAARIAAE